MRLVFALLFVSTLAVADDEIVATSLNGQVTSSTPMIGGVSIAVDTNDPNLDVDLLVVAAGVNNFDPVLELRTLNGNLLFENDDVGTPVGTVQQQRQSIIQCYINAGIINPQPRDSVILATLPAVPTSTSYLAYMRGFNGTTGQGILTFLQVDSDTVLRLTNCPDI